MVCCAVPTCTNNNYKSSANSSKTKWRFFTLPKDPDKRQLWLEKINRKGYFNQKTARVCSEHFIENDYRSRHRLLNYPSSKILLRPDAVPSLKLPLQATYKKGSNGKSKDIADQMEATFDFVAVEDEIPISEPIQVSGNSDEVRTNRALHEYIETLKDEIKRLKSQIADKESIKKCRLGQIFSEMQIKRLTAPTTGNISIKWTPEDICQSIALFYSGPHAYQLLLERCFPFPSVRVLRTWAEQMNLKPGILSPILELMKGFNIPRKRKLCVLLADEMINEFDRNSTSFHVVMVRGLVENWSQPIYYSPDTPVSKDILQQLISRVQNIGYTVVALTIDIEGVYRKLLTELSVSSKHPYFQNPVSGRNVYVFADVPSLLKTMRLQFLKSGFHIKDKIVNSDSVAEVMQLNVNILDARQQTLNLARQLFSSNIATELLSMNAIGMTTNPSSAECAVLLQSTSNWFQLFHSKPPENDLAQSKDNAYGLNITEQNKTLDAMGRLIKKLRVSGQNTFASFQEGILLSTNSLKLLFSDLQKHILTGRLNLEPLRRFFMEMMIFDGRRSFPSEIEFKNRLRDYVAGVRQERVEIDDQTDCDNDECQVLTVNLLSGLL